jgi:hypothetical protein
LENAPDILAQIRSNLNALSKGSDGRLFYVTVSPATVTYLEGGTIPQLREHADL